MIEVWGHKRGEKNPTLLCTVASPQAAELAVQHLIASILPGGRWERHKDSLGGTVISTRSGRPRAQIWIEPDAKAISAYVLPARFMAS